MRMLLTELYEELARITSIDQFDWQYVCHFAEQWKTSIADALLDLHFVDETTLAESLAKATHLEYIPGHKLQFDFDGVDLETFDDLMNVGAAPLSENRLAVCNPYDDVRGNLANWLAQREIVVTERTSLVDSLRRFSISELLV